MSAPGRLRRVIATNVRIRRARLALTQEALAERAGVSAQHVRSVEQAAREPRLDMLDKLAGALRVSAADLLREPQEGRGGERSNSTLAGDTVLQRSPAAPGRSVSRGRPRGNRTGVDPADLFRGT